MRLRLCNLAAAQAALLAFAALACGGTIARAEDNARAEDGPSAVLVIDGSGSMWGRLAPDNRAKIDIVREKLATLLQTPSTTRLGLVSFGHRRRGDCGDVEVIAPPGSDRDAVLAPLAKLNPRGPGPVTAALKAAVDAIGATRPAQIVIVGDGADNCQPQPDTCEVAKSIAQSSPGVVVHVVGIGIPPAERPRMVCIAEATGGHYYDIADSNGLNAALDETTRLAILTPNSVAHAASAPGAPPALPPPPTGASLRASAALAQGGALLTVPLRWRIFKAGDNAVLGESMASGISAKLSAGNYDIEARLGSIAARQQITVVDGGAESIVVPLGAAHLTARASAVKGGPASPSAVLTIASGDAPVAIGRDGSFDLYLPPAEYTVTVVDGATRAAETLTLAAGDDKPLDFALGTGRLDVSATTGADGRTPDDVLYTIFEDDPESPDGRREVARSRAANASFTLPAGTYYVSARSGAGDVRRRIAVGAGESVKQALVLALAPLKVSTVIAGTPASRDSGVLYRVDRLDGGKERVARAIGPELSLTLPPGRYRVSASLAALHLAASTEVTLEAGRPAEAKLDIEGGRVRFTPRAADSVSNGDIYWEVVDANGMPVWRTTGNVAQTVLAPGRYTVRLDIRSKHKEAAFDVRAGESQEIEVGPG